MEPDPQSNSKKPRRAIYLLPNLFTTSALFAGFFAIISAVEGRFENAAIAILLAIILDGLDGRIARLTNTQSDFGAEYDSLSDMISFGLAPALVIYEWSLSSLRDYGFVQLGWGAAFLYVACAALRLARFNTNIGISDKRFFQGLASPAAAAIIASLVWVANSTDLTGENLVLLALLTTIVSGLLMVSKFTYYSFKDIGSYMRISFLTLLAIVGFFVIVLLDPPKVAFACFVLYALSGPGWFLWRVLRRRNR